MHHQHQWAGYGHAPRQRAFASFRRPKYNVPLNIIDHGDHYEVFVYAVSFEKENIDVRVVGDNLVIQGTRPHDKANDPAFLLQEYPIKSFERVLPLSDRVDTGGITARQKNGVLIVYVPKKAEPQTPEQVIAVA
jgi:HSP20 family protein